MFIRFIFIISSIIILSACSNPQEEITYEGESDEWNVTYTAKEGVDDSYTFEFIGNSSIPSEISYEFNSFSVEERPLSENGVYQGEHSGSEEVSSGSMEVTIYWSDASETLTLEES